MDTKAATSRRVLIVAYHFPPNASSGSFRPLKFVKYLEQFGWESVVVCADARSDPDEPQDPSLLEELPPSVCLLVSNPWRVALGDGQAHQLKDGESRSGRLDRSKGKALGNLFRRFHFFHPHQRWYLAAVVCGLIAIRRYRPETIFTTSPPYSCALIGLTLKVLTGIPLISDFRDPWIGNLYRRRPSRIGEKLMRYCERKVFERSERVIFVSPQMTDYARRRAPKVDGEKFMVLANGFDPEDMPRHSGNHDGKQFRLVYVGTFYEGVRDPRNFLEGLSRFLSRHPDAASYVNVHFAGDPQWGKSHADWLAQLALERQVRFSDFVPHRQAMELIGKADVLLLIVSTNPDDRGQIPAKVFEYIAARKPILALCHEGATASLLKSTGLGLIIDPTDPEAVAAALQALFTRFRSGTLKCLPVEDELRKYDRRSQTKQLAGVFDELTRGLHANG